MVRAPHRAPCRGGDPTVTPRFIRREKPAEKISVHEAMRGYGTERLEDLIPPASRDACDGRPGYHRHARAERR